MQTMDEIYQEYAQRVYRYLLSLTLDSSLSEELTQETFYQAIRSIHRYDETCRLSTWLCGIARNVLFTYRRKHPPGEELEEQELTVPSAEEEVMNDADRLSLFHLLHNMPEPYREVLYLRIFGNLSFREIGEICGNSENWARVTFYRGKGKLRKEVENHDADSM